MSTPIAPIEPYFSSLGGRKMLVLLIAVAFAVAVIAVALFRAVPTETLGEVFSFLEVVILAYMGANAISAGSTAVAKAVGQKPAPTPGVELLSLKVSDSEDLPKKRGE